jgi:hypothetical protein
MRLSRADNRLTDSPLLSKNEAIAGTGIAGVVSAQIRFDIRPRHRLCLETA